MDNTPLLSLPLLADKQDLQTTFHDDGMKALDALVMLSAIDRDLSSPPASPDEGDRYIVKAPGSGDVAWEDDNVVVFIDGHWRAHPPQPGWTCYVQDEGALIAWDGTAWQPALDVLGGGAANNLALLGVGTTADVTNPFSAKLNNALWVAKTVAEGGDGHLRYKLSKEAAAKTLSLLFQDNFSGRAEIGLTGDNDLHFKVSADGSAWIEALTIDHATGRTRLCPDDALLGFALINGTLAVSAASNALTVAVKTHAGGDPSPADPVHVVFRDAAAATGGYGGLAITSAASLVLSSGSTLGVASATPFRLWIVGLNDGGTFRLGAINCWTASGVQPLADGLASAAAEGGAGGADSAGVIYAGAAVSAKPMRILGCLEWNTSGLTAGSWTTTNLDSVALFGPGMSKPGDLVQHRHVADGGVATGTVTIPFDDTIPQNTEGDQYMSLAITPTSAANLLLIDTIWQGTSSDIGQLTAALFRDSAANALAAADNRVPEPGMFVPIPLSYRMRASVASSTTFTVRAGLNNAGTTTFNGAAGTRRLGGVMQSSMDIMEVTA